MNYPIITNETVKATTASQSGKTRPHEDAAGSTTSRPGPMSLPRYPMPVPHTQFTLKSPATSTSFMSQDSSSGLMGRMRNAFGSLNLTGSKKPQSSSTGMTWAQFTSAMNDMNFDSIIRDKGSMMSKHQMISNPFITSNNPLAGMTPYNSLPMSTISMHPGEFGHFCTILLETNRVTSEITFIKLSYISVFFPSFVH